jgi:hypothetical protein
MKNIPMDPSYVPLQPFKEGLQKMPSQITMPKPKKKRENHASKFAWNIQKKKKRKGKKKKRRKPPPSLPETKHKSVKEIPPNSCPK